MVDFLFKRREAGEEVGGGFGGGWRGGGLRYGCGGCGLRGGCFGDGGEELGVAFGAAAGGGGDLLDEGLVALGEGGEEIFHVVEGVEGLHARGAAAQFAEGLRASDEEFGKDRKFSGGAFEDTIGFVAVLADAAAGGINADGQLLFTQAFDGSEDIVF